MIDQIALIILTYLPLWMVGIAASLAAIMLLLNFAFHDDMVTRGFYDLYRPYILPQALFFIFLACIYASLTAGILSTNTTTRGLIRLSLFLVFLSHIFPYWGALVLAWERVSPMFLRFIHVPIERGINKDDLPAE